MNIGNLTYAGKNSLTDLGVYVTGSGTHNAAERDTTTFSIAGRNGDLIVDNGRYKNIQVIYPAFIPHTFGAEEQKVRNWLRTGAAYSKIADTYDTTHFRLGRPVGELTFEPVRPNGANFQITFDCDPRRFLVSGETPIDIMPTTRSVVFTAGKHINATNGEIIDNSTRSATVDYIPVDSATEYAISYTGSGNNVVAFYDANYGYLSALTTWTSAPRTFTTLQNAAFVRFSYDSGTAPTNAQIISGDLVVFTSGKNINSSGEIVGNANRSATIDGYSVLQGYEYTILYSGSGGVGVFYYDATDTFLSMETGWGTPPSRTFTTPEGAAFVRFAYNSGTAPASALLYCATTLVSITNPTPFASRPLFKITNPAQNDVLTANGKSITFVSAYTGEVVIDCETQDAYSGTANLNGIISVTDFPELAEGANLIAWSGAGDCKLIPRWWEL